eukprot:1912573-Prymnesium_polylepis.1
MSCPSCMRLARVSPTGQSGDTCRACPDGAPSFPLTVLTPPRVRFCVHVPAETGRMRGKPAACAGGDLHLGVRDGGRESRASVKLQII